MGCALAMQNTLAALDKVHSGILPFDRTIKVSLTERLTKEQIIARMPHNLATLEHLSEQNRRDFNRLLNRRTPAAVRTRGPQAFHSPPPQDAHAGGRVEPPHAAGAGHDAANGRQRRPHGPNPPSPAHDDRHPGHAGQAGQPARRTPQPDGREPGNPQEPATTAAT